MDRKVSYAVSEQRTKQVTEESSFVFQSFDTVVEQRPESRCVADVGTFSTLLVNIDNSTERRTWSR